MATRAPYSGAGATPGLTHTDIESHTPTQAQFPAMSMVSVLIKHVVSH